MHRTAKSFLLFSALLAPSFATADDDATKIHGELILKDTFDRIEAKPDAEDVGGGWSTNSKSRAQGVKQADLAEGALRIERADVADHGVSVVHSVEFKDAVIQLRFKLDKADTLGINIADPSEKSVHAGHICLAQVKLNKLEITDLKTGRMELDRRTRRLKLNESGEALPAADTELLKTKSKYFDLHLKPDTWYELTVKITGETITVSIDGEEQGSFTSVGIGHKTKNLLRLAVARNAWVDDIYVWRTDNQ